MNAIIPKNRNLRLLLLGCVTAVVAIPLLLHREPSVYRERRQRIETMSAAEHSRLEHNFERFLAMSEAERDSYRRLHEAIEEDAREGGSLREVMHNYYDWLKTLDAWDREKLRQAEDSLERSRLVRELKQEQESDEKRWRRKSFVKRVFDSDVRLNDEDLSAVINAVEDQLNLSDDLRRELHSLSPFLRSLNVVKAALDRTDEPRIRGRTPWPDDQLADRLLAVITDESVVKAVREAQTKDKQRMFLALLIADSLTSEWWNEWKRLSPNEEESQRFFVQLEPEQQDEIMREPPERQKKELHKLYLKEHHPRFAESSGLLMWKVRPQLTPGFRRGLRHRHDDKDQKRGPRRRRDPS